MSDQPRPITDELLLSELTVGEFKQLMVTILTEMSSTPAENTENSPAPPEKISVRRKSLDEFMSDLGSS